VVGWKAARLLMELLDLGFSTETHVVEVVAGDYRQRW
jgi:hypothetical protein